MFKSKKNSALIALGSSIIVYLMVMMLSFNISKLIIIRFVFANIFAILLPGMAIFSLLNLKMSRTGTFCMSYILGYAFIVVEYFISEAFGRKIPFVAVMVIFGMVSLLVLSRRLKDKKPLLDFGYTGNENVEAFFLVLFLFFNVFAYAAYFLGPEVVPVVRSSMDMHFWTNNTVALKIAWPPEYLYMDGMRLNYHYFSNIPIAFLCDIFKIDVHTMSFPLYAMTKAIVMVGAVQFGVSSISNDKKVNIVGYILLLCTTGVENANIVTFYHHTFMSPFGYDMGYAYGIVFVAFLKRQWDDKRFEWKYFLGMILAWMMCVGAKAPVASVLILLAALFCLYWLVHKKWFLAFGYGMPILGVFLLICKYCVGMFSVFQGESAWKLSLYGTEHFTMFGEPEAWDLIGWMLVLLGEKNAVLGIAVRTLLLNPAVEFGVIMVAVPIFWTYRKKVSGQKVYQQISLGLTTLWGIGLWHFVKAGGNSEMYFAMASLIPMVLILLSALTVYVEEVGGVHDKQNFLLKKPAVIVLILLTALGVYRYMGSAWRGTGAFRNVQGGMSNLHHATDSDYYSGFVDTGIRNTDVEALSWLRENAEPDAVVMSDKATLLGNGTYYLYGIFSERQQYLEGSLLMGTHRQDVNDEIARRKEMIKGVYGNKENSIQRAKEEGIDYIVQTLDITPDFQCDYELLDLVFSSSTMKIYKIK